ncbi:MAG: hypothetical protein ABEJ98_04830 [Candidatus Nanohaloarchaea archaeon]
MSIVDLAKGLGKTFISEDRLKRYRAERKLSKKSKKKPLIIITLDSCRYDTFEDAYDGEGGGVEEGIFYLFLDNPWP